ncbi:hypothetical protein AVEN_118485-1 [Araneus ventricosus]|uniref:Uncharacterized protein n=1 Tax=Araneus ventricosus TaxID=182803 RepID=A0A4Y2T690_ARAVE|nr:hypothetical protein AVEN_118485-1 [Araneus ventricosus]
MGPKSHGIITVPTSRSENPLTNTAVSHPRTRGANRWDSTIRYIHKIRYQLRERDEGRNLLEVDVKEDTDRQLKGTNLRAEGAELLQTWTKAQYAWSCCGLLRLDAHMRFGTDKSLSTQNAGEVDC